MKIVILDEATLNRKERIRNLLESYGDIKIYPRIESEHGTENYKKEIIEKIEDAEIVITNKAIIDKEVMDQCKNIKYIGVTATGYDVVDIQYAREKNIVVTNVPAYSSQSVAQMTMALILELTNKVGLYNKSVHDGEWCNTKDFCYFKSPIIGLAGKTIGLIGYGGIGVATAKIAQAFGMKVLVHKRNVDRKLETDNLKFAKNLDELLENSDIISLHCPATSETTGIINKENLEKMKNTAFLINTSRGKLVVEEDLKEALNNDIIAGAALDVVTVEPMKKDNPLLEAKNCIITPHIAWGSEDSKLTLVNIVVDNVKSFINGDVINQVN